MDMKNDWNWPEITRNHQKLLEMNSNEVKSEILISIVLWPKEKNWFPDQFIPPCYNQIKLAILISECIYGILE